MKKNHNLISKNQKLNLVIQIKLIWMILQEEYIEENLEMELKEREN